MVHFLIALKTVLPLFIVILAGILFSRTKACSQQWVKILNKYALNIGFPALVIASLMHLEIREQSFSNLIFLNSANVIFCTLLAFPIAWIFRFSEQIKRSLFLILPFTNNAYLGMPILQNAYGNEVLPIAAIIAATYLFWMFTLTIILLEITGENKIHPGKIFLNLVQNPLLISVIVAFAIVAFDIKLPDFAEETIHLFANSVTAVVLFSLGIFLGLHQIGKLSDWLKALAFAVFTMLALPFVFYLAVKNTTTDPLQLKATILDAAMPLGLTPYALAVQYKIEVALVSRIVVLATLLAVFVIPFWIVVVG